MLKNRTGVNKIKLIVGKWKIKAACHNKLDSRILLFQELGIIQADCGDLIFMGIPGFQII